MNDPVTQSIRMIFALLVLCVGSVAAERFFGIPLGQYMHTVLLVSFSICIVALLAVMALVAWSIMTHKGTRR